MNRRGLRDVVVVGGGVVGAACALGMAQAGLDVVLVEAHVPAPWSVYRPDLRVYALADDNIAQLDALDAWASIRAARAQPYRRMRVWDAAGGDALVFDADTFARSELGWIVEHGLIVDRLWARLAAAGVVQRHARVQALAGNDAAGVQLELDDGTQVSARIAIAADGAASSLRRLAGIGVRGRAHRQQGVVAYVATQQPHQDTAWQRFLPTGPIALLPCSDGRSSIVWTLPDAEADRVMALDDMAFADAVTRASGGCLGDIGAVSPRAAFPLQRQLADRLLSGRVLVVGDAAHVVHPLAGQGVNLGLRDVAALLASIGDARTRNVDWTTPQRLARWARTRRSENTAAAYAMDGINALFSNDAVPATLLRGHVLGIANRLPGMAGLLWKRASGG